MPPRVESLTVEQAGQLLAPIGKVCIRGIERTGSINDVFRVTTTDRGNFYVKFHTARWYANEPDAFFCVEREAAVHQLLAKRGMPLPYVAWGDLTRKIVPLSCYICGELPGRPITEAIAADPAAGPRMLRELGAYFRRLHVIEFGTAGLLDARHAVFAPPTGPVPAMPTVWDGGSMHRAEALQRDSLEQLERLRRERLLPEATLGLLEGLFRRTAEVAGEGYWPPRFTVGNCHAYHFYVDRRGGEYDVTGFYDFEAVSAGNPLTDIVELAVTLTPSTHGLAWQEPFFEGYGRLPPLEPYKIFLLSYLLPEYGTSKRELIPDPPWFAGRLPSLLSADTWDALEWYPGGNGK
ncbi:MAG: aminoglycoside phosphotransferase family protein [Phycisphaeraceae bacterium]|nr:aminoglycoside phosphotransferase family protein [Phycisphaeraceae bacterium]